MNEIPINLAVEDALSEDVSNRQAYIFAIPHPFSHAPGGIIFTSAACV